MSRFVAWVSRAIDAIVDVANRVWRPATCVGIAGSLVVNGIIIPLWAKVGADLVGLAALVASLTPFVVARTVEKIKQGTDENV